MKWDEGTWTGLIWLQDADKWPALANAVMIISGSIKCKEFHYVRHQQLTKKHPAPRSSSAATAMDPVYCSPYHTEPAVLSRHNTQYSTAFSEHFTKYVDLNDGIASCAPGDPTVRHILLSAQHRKFFLRFL